MQFTQPQSSLFGSFACLVQLSKVSDSFYNSEQAAVFILDDTGIFDNRYVMSFFVL